MVGSAVSIWPLIFMLMNTDKSNLILLGLLLLVWLGVAGVAWLPARGPKAQQPQAAQPQPSSDQVEAQVVIDFGNGTRRAFAGPVEPGTKALDAMSYAAAAGQLALEFAGQNEMAVVRVGEITNTVERRWQVDLNGRGPLWRLQETEVRPGDKLQLTFR